MTDFTRPNEYENAFGPSWRTLNEFERIVIEAMTESDSEFEALAASVEAEAADDGERMIADVMRHFAEWVGRR